MRLTLLPSAAAAMASTAVCTSAFAVDYMNADQAAKLMFPQADAFEARSVALDTAREQGQVQQLESQDARGRSTRWSVRIARRAGATLGFVVTDEVIGKIESIGFAVGLGLDGRVVQIEILSYRESHGFEIRLPAWRRQFVGKGPAAALRIGDDIANISGATLSCTHVTDGVRRIVAIVALAQRQGTLT